MTPLEAETQAAEELLEDAAKRIKAIIGDSSIDVERKVMFAVSEPEAIISEAHANGTCSHIVMGNRGHGELAELILGSTSHHVIREAHCPVTIIRP